MTVVPWTVEEIRDFENQGGAGLLRDRVVAEWFITRTRNTVKELRERLVDLQGQVTRLQVSGRQGPAPGRPEDLIRYLPPQVLAAHADEAARRQLGAMTSQVAMLRRSVDILQSALQSVASDPALPPHLRETLSRALAAGTPQAPGPGQPPPAGPPAPPQGGPRTPTR